MSPPFFAREALQLIRFLDRPDLVQWLPLSLEELAEPEATVPIAAYYDLWEAAVASTGETRLGVRFAGEAVVKPNTSVGALTFLLLSSPTLGVGLKRLASYQPLWNAGERFQFLSRGHRHVLRFTPWGPAREAHRHVVDKTVVPMVLTPRALVDGGAEPTVVRVAFPKPSGSDPLEELLQTRVQYGSRYNEVEMPARSLDKPMLAANDFLFGYFDQQLSKKLAETTSLADRVAREISARLHSEPPTVEEIAVAVNLSTRELQRRLRREGASVRMLLEKVRRTRAESLLRTNVSLREVAFLTGFAEVTNFSRAFRRWTGQTPSDWRASRDDEASGSDG